MKRPCPTSGGLNEKALTILMRILAYPGRPPSMRELGLLAGIKSPNGVACHLRRLVRMGLLKRGPARQARTTTPTVKYIPARKLGPAQAIESLVAGVEVAAGMSAEQMLNKLILISDGAKEADGLP